MALPLSSEKICAERSKSPRTWKDTSYDHSHVPERAVEIFIDPLSDHMKVVKSIGVPFTGRISPVGIDVSSDGV